MSKYSREDMVVALNYMALQYLDNDGILDHHYMSAGEQCLSILEEEGHVTGSGRKYEWTSKGRSL